MGCWNATCGISQLPIPFGAKVKTMLLLQSPYAHAIMGSSPCYSTDYFRPWFFPVTAEYNDYGSIENIEMDWNAQYMLETFQKWHKEGKIRILDKDAEINSPEVFEFETLDQVFDCVKRGALIYNQYVNKFNHSTQTWVPETQNTKIAMFMVLVPVWDAMLKEVVRYYNLPENEYFREHDRDIKEKSVEVIEKIRSISHKEGELFKIREFIVSEFLGDSPGQFNIFNHYKNILYNPEKVNLDEFFLKLDEVKNISMAMSVLRKLFFPQCGSGSQSEEFSFNRALIEGMNTHMTEREKQIEQW